MRLQIFEIASIVRGEMLFVLIDKTVGCVAFSLWKLPSRAQSIVWAFVALHKLLSVKLCLNNNSSVEIQNLYNTASF